MCMEDKFVNIKIRKEFRDMIKEYSKKHGYKMYALIEEIIKRCYFVENVVVIILILLYLFI